MNKKESFDLEKITNVLFHAADAWAHRHAPRVRARVMSRIRSTKTVSPFVRWGLAGLATSVAVILIFVFTLPTAPPGSTVSPTIQRATTSPVYPIIRLEKKQGKIIVRADGVNGPLFLHKATDPKTIQETPPIRLEKPVFEDTASDRNTIVYYLVEPAPAPSRDS